MLSQLNYKHLYYFWVISKEGSIKKAAMKLYLTSSTLSDQLKKLEDNLGQKLFDRHGRNLVLNDTGKTVFNYLDRFFPEGEELFETIVNKKENISKIIRIGIIPTISYNLVYKFLSPVMDSNLFTIKVIQGGFDYLLEEIEKLNIDIIISDYRHNYLGKYLEQHKIMERNFYAVSSFDFKIPEEEFPKCLDGLKYIGYTSNNELHYQIQQFFYKHNIRPIFNGELDSIDLIKLGTLDSYCFSILPMTAIKSEINNNQLHVIGKMDELSSSVFVIMNKKDVNKKLMKTLNLVES